MQTFEVGGCVRDELLGLKSKDIDFTVVLDNNWASFWNEGAEPYDVMVANLEMMGVKIIRGNDGLPVGHEFLTARGIHPKRGAVDYVLARKESDYTDGRRPDKVEVGTLEDDLARRDFTMNAIAKNADGSLIDPFNGQADIQARIIRAVGDPMERLMEDALRALRALRFAVTKRFSVDDALDEALRSQDVAIALERISDERIQQELSKMFRYDTIDAMRTLSFFPLLTAAAFSGSVSLDATMKTKGRGK